MDRKKIVLIGLVVLVSGCTSISPTDGENPTDSNEGGGELESNPAEGKGLEVTKFSITDDTLTPGQRAVVQLTLQNYHTTDIEIHDLYMYNLGGLEVVDEGDCGTEIMASQNGLNPQKQCTWTIEAPEENSLGSFRDKTYNPRMLINYSSRLTNVKKPLKVTFKPGDEIDSTERVSKSFSNGEMSATITSDSPIPNEGSANLEVELEPSHESHMVSNSYKVNIRPSQIIGGVEGDGGSACSGIGGSMESSNDGIFTVNVPTDIGKTASFSCQISSQATKQVERNIIIATFYKYQQSPALDIEVKSLND